METPEWIDLKVPTGTGRTVTISKNRDRPQYRWYDTVSGIASIHIFYDTTDDRFLQCKLWYRSLDGSYNHLDLDPRPEGFDEHPAYLGDWYFTSGTLITDIILNDIRENSQALLRT